jgi:hypothetical protein
MDLLDAVKVCEGYRICEDALVYFWNNRKMWGAYAGLTSAPFTNGVTRWRGCVNSLCPTSGRYVYTDDSYMGFNFKRIAVVDLF